VSRWRGGRGRRLAAVIVLATAAVASGCRASGFQLVRTTDLRFTSPPPNSAVSAPVTVSWASSPQLRFGEPGGPVRYGVFVDRAPMAPGGGLRGLFRHNTLCSNPSCLSLEFLEENSVYLTTADSVTITNLLPRHGGGLHSILLVLIDASGHRIGESSFTLWLKDAHVQG
jgi:hypothetical protein